MCWGAGRPLPIGSKSAVPAPFPAGLTPASLMWSGVQVFLGSSWPWAKAMCTLPSESKIRCPQSATSLPAGYGSMPTLQPWAQGLPPCPDPRAPEKAPPSTGFLRMQCGLEHLTVSSSLCRLKMAACLSLAAWIYIYFTSPKRLACFLIGMPS